MSGPASCRRRTRTQGPPPGSCSPAPSLPAAPPAAAPGSSGPRPRPAPPRRSPRHCSPPPRSPSLHCPCPRRRPSSRPVGGPRVRPLHHAPPVRPPLARTSASPSNCRSEASVTTTLSSSFWLSSGFSTCRDSQMADASVGPAPSPAFPDRGRPVSAKGPQFREEDGAQERKPLPPVPP